MTIKDSKYTKKYGVKLCEMVSNLITGKMKRYSEEINGSKYLTLAPTNESKKAMKKYKELRRKIRYLIRLTTKE